ncbi:MAG: flippase-like domain-containing protein [Acidobacteria bacterium]|nr:flippase-like domain-containing protein [Acidobacteriota bacterium]
MLRRAKLPLILLLLGVAAWVVYRASRSTEWTSFRSERFWQSLAGVQILWLALGVLLIYASYLFRSLRWREFLAPIKTASLANILTATLIGFTAVGLLGRPGEVVRPYLISRSEGVDLSSQFGAWTLERIFDALTVGMLIGVVLVISPPVPHSSSTGASVIARLKFTGIVLCAGGIVVAAVLARLRQFSPLIQRLASLSAWLVPQRYRQQFQTGLARVLGSFTEGLTAVGTVRQFGTCVALSLLVWLAILLAYRALVYAFGPPLSNLSLGAVVLVLAVTIVGSVAQLPAVGGGPQIATMLVLTQFFGIPLEIASTAAILLWAITFMAVLAPGLPLAAREGLTWQRLRSISRGDATAGR